MNGAVMSIDTKAKQDHRHIVAIGGGETSLDVMVYSLSWSRTKRPKVLLINTATGDMPAYLAMMYSATDSTGLRAITSGTVRTHTD